jgi:hypothetical protein
MQDKEKFSCPFQSTDNFPEWKLALRLVTHSGKLSMDWNGQENFSLSCELWVGTNDFNTTKNVLVRSNPRIIFVPEWPEISLYPATARSSIIN